MKKLSIEQTTEATDSVSTRSCKSCVHSAVCEARRTLYRSFKQFDNEFGDMVDIGVIHTEENSCVDLLAKSCKHYLSAKTVPHGGIHRRAPVKYVT